MPKPVPETPQTLDEIHLKVMTILEQQPDISQRELARQLDISLGKINYCLKALLDKGLIKTRNFKNNKNKLNYLYILTPPGIETKTRLTYHFLKRKMIEYERLKQEIDSLSDSLNNR